MHLRSRGRKRRQPERKGKGAVGQVDECAFAAGLEKAVWRGRGQALVTLTSLPCPSSTSSSPPGLSLPNSSVIITLLSRASCWPGPLTCPEPKPSSLPSMPDQSLLFTWSSQTCHWPYPTHHPHSWPMTFPHVAEPGRFSLSPWMHRACLISVPGFVLGPCLDCTSSFPLSIHPWRLLEDSVPIWPLPRWLPLISSSIFASLLLYHPLRNITQHWRIFKWCMFIPSTRFIHSFILFTYF